MLLLNSHHVVIWIWKIWNCESSNWVLGISDLSRLATTFNYFQRPVIWIKPQGFLISLEESSPSRHTKKVQKGTWSNGSLLYGDERQILVFSLISSQLGKNFTTLDNAASHQKSTPGEDDFLSNSHWFTKKKELLCMVTVFLFAFCQESIDLVHFIDGYLKKNNKKGRNCSMNCVSN